MSEDYFEEEPRIRGRMFGSAWKQLLADHLRDCYRQRRVFREALNDVRSELLTETARMHRENQEKMDEMATALNAGQQKIEAFQKAIFIGVISTLASILVYFVTHFGPFAKI